jgi:primosomal protein N' (replication factor Y)
VFPLVDVVVPGPWWNCLTYRCVEEELSEGCRVRVPLGRGTRTAFVTRSGSGENPVAVSALRNVMEVLDRHPVFPPSLWHLSGWIGETFLCGRGMALGDMLPPDILSGAPCEAFPFPRISERECPADTLVYRNRDAQRFEEYERLIRETKGSSLVLFPEYGMARRFFDSLTEKSDVLLWPGQGGKRLRAAWDATRRGIPRVVVSAPGGCYAPLPQIDLVVLEEENAASYDSQKYPYMNYRMIAARRAREHYAHLVLGGRMPSSRVFRRYTPVSGDRPGSRLILVRKSDVRKKTAVGVEGQIPIGQAILRTTEKTLRQSRVALWILDRVGYAIGIRCDDCEKEVTCGRCGGTLRWKQGETFAVCTRCNTHSPVPERCPVCGGFILKGDRPGIETLCRTAARCAGDGRVVECNAGDFSVARKRKDIERHMSGGGILLGTRGILPFCDILPVGLVCWIDPEVELGFARYFGSVLLFSMIWESCWRGNDVEKRRVLVQTSDMGARWIKGLRQGWNLFWSEEIRERREMALPPYTLQFEIEASREIRKDLLESLTQANIDVIPWSDGNERAIVVGGSLRVMVRAMEKHFSIRASGMGFPRIRVRME